MRMVTFLNNGPEQQTGLIVMKLEDMDNLDAKFSEIVVLINTNPEPITFSDPSLSDKAYSLHPVQKNSYDRVLLQAGYNGSNATFTVPAITTAVFVVERPQVTESEPKAAANAILPIGLAVAGVVLISGVLYWITRRKGKEGAK